jgi:hypothetical protein
MSVITAVSTIVGLDALVLGLLAYVLRMPFRLAPSQAVTAAPAQPVLQRAVANGGPHTRSAHGPALAQTRRVSVTAGD